MPGKSTAQFNLKTERWQLSTETLSRTTRTRPLGTRPSAHGTRPLGTRPQLLHVEPSILHTFNLKLLKTKATHSPPPSRFQIHLGWLQELREAKKHFSFFKSSFQKASKVKFSSGQSKDNGILTSQAGLIQLSIRKRCFFCSDAVVCLVKHPH